MSVTQHDLMKRVENATGYNSRIVRTICDAFLKEYVRELVKGENKITIQKLMTVEMKPSYKPGTVRGGFVEVSPNARRLVATLTESVKRRVPQEGIEAVMKDLWGI